MPLSEIDIGEPQPAATLRIPFLSNPLFTFLLPTPFVLQLFSPSLSLSSSPLQFSFTFFFLLLLAISLDLSAVSPLRLAFVSRAAQPGILQRVS